MNVRAALLGLVVAIGCGSSGGAGGSLRPVLWHVTETTRENVFEVEALYGGSSCSEFRRWDVEESATSVRVEAIVEYTDVEVCTDDLLSEMHTVRLAEPLAERDLLGCDPDDETADCTLLNRLGDM